MRLFISFLTFSTISALAINMGKAHPKSSSAKRSHDDDDDYLTFFIYVYIYIYKPTCLSAITPSHSCHQFSKR